jgi:hypothetical protein
VNKQPIRKHCQSVLIDEIALRKRGIMTNLMPSFLMVRNIPYPKMPALENQKKSKGKTETPKLNSVIHQNTYYLRVENFLKCQT